MKAPSSTLRMRLPRRERGAALLVALVMLLIMSMIGVTAMQGSAMQERMAGNSRDRNLAFQAAEAALREAEIFLELPGALPDFINAGGLYQANALNRPVWHGPAPAVGNGSLIYAGDLGAQIALPPEYFIEELRDIILPGIETETPPPPSNISYYRVTARGFGGSADAVVVLTSIYRRD